MVAREDVGGLGHEVHAAEHDVLGLLLLLSENGQPVAVAPGVDPAHDLIALVVVPEDEQPLPERRLRGGDPFLELLEGCVGVALVELSLQSQHVLVPSGWGFRLRTAGTARSPLPRGCRPRNC